MLDSDSVLPYREEECDTILRQIEQTVLQDAMSLRSKLWLHLQKYEKICTWLHTQNDALGGMTPASVIQVGQGPEAFRRVLQALEEECSSLPASNHSSCEA